MRVWSQHELFLTSTTLATETTYLPLVQVDNILELVLDDVAFCAVPAFHIDIREANTQSHQDYKTGIK